jgi:hypothetical protein
MTLRMRAQQHEPPEPGVYRGRLVDVHESEGQYGPFAKFFFELLEEGHEGQTIRGQASIPESFTAATKIWQWAQALLGRPIQPGEEIDLKDLIGNECMLTLGHKETDHGTFATVEAVNPVRRNKPKKQAPPEPSEIEEVDEDDEEDDDELEAAPF